ncbi:hypothetical protein LSH36_206g00029 [Paralvinella palmiformis]|uniref:Ubiquitin-protein ligase E3B n=1 Tax=Paralvinella palmiformis TaxID=53620 RepID=A0AAD9JPV7_9ANNE|nr:hypothetical protein LSH36_206g00029 [Paralvinella palmiformis]
MFGRVDLGKKNQFLDKAKSAREERAQEKYKESSLIKIQALVRRFLVRCSINKQIRKELDLLIQLPKAAEDEYKPTFKSATEVFQIIRRFMFVMKENEDQLRFEYLCKYILASMNAESIKPENQTDMRLITTCLHMLITFTNPNPWKILQGKQGEVLKPSLVKLCNNLMGDLNTRGLYPCLQILLTQGLSRSRPAFKSASLSASVTIALRPLIAANFSQTLLTSFVLHIMSVPALIEHVFVMSQECLVLLMTHRLFKQCVELLCNEQSTRIVFNILEGNYALCLLANLIQLGMIEMEGLLENTQNFMFVVRRLLESCRRYVQGKKSNLTHWHPVLGWFAQKTDQGLHDAMPNVVKQLKHLWGMKMIHLLFEPLFAYADFKNVEDKRTSKMQTSPSKNFLKKAFEKASSKPSSDHVKLNSPVLMSTCTACGMYLSAISTLTQLKFDILAALFDVLIILIITNFISETTLRRIHKDKKMDKKNLEDIWRNLSDHCGITANRVYTGLVPNSQRIHPHYIGVLILQWLEYRWLQGSGFESCSCLCLWDLFPLAGATQPHVPGLCYQDILLPKLWFLLQDVGSQNGLKPFMELLVTKPNSMDHPLFDLLHMACVTAAHIITILDEVELYEQEKPFAVKQLVTISTFLNQFICKTIWNELLDVQVARSNDIYQAAHTLLMILYERDCRRSYTPKDHWLIKDVKPSAFLADLDKGKRNAQFLLQKVPHIIPHKERVILFRRNVTREKEVLGLLESACVSPQSTLITVHRSRIIEDGYRQLAIIPVNSLKGLIRVKFINEQGLDEAGIDQDGVFKEFLEETIKKVFDPSLNLFRVMHPDVDNKANLGTNCSVVVWALTISINNRVCFCGSGFVEQSLLPGISCFDVFQGIVVDVPFASFFLSQILGQQHSATYSSMDELPSLDPELYKSLTYVKHYESDLSDLELTFSYDEDIMGKLVNHELIPGGKAVTVTNENKISYVHLMAHFKIRVQIKEQTSAFIHGFRSVINIEWLQMFSAPELQKLISGETGDIDLDDLRKHTQYYGGFHNNHRVINWLWDTLEKDFTPQERSLFLKFVTSCSKSPLLGFAHMEPPFSIRCVEVSDEQDTGDTVGSVLKGFFNIRKKDPVGRLPTSSTCFNLLKLPNYQKKSTLREKLRYAITSNTGFELS